MYLFLSIIVQMCDDQRDRLKDYWSSTLEQFFLAFYRNTMKQDRFFHILRFLHFSDNRNEPDKTGKNYDKFSSSIYQRNKQFGIKIYKLCDSKGYTYMSVYLGRDRKHTTAAMTANHATVSGLTTRIENLGHKLYMDNVLS
jgi:hypothetical protein